MISEKITTLKIIHLAMCAGTIMAYIFTGEFTVAHLQTLNMNTEDLIYLVIPVAAFFISNYLFRSQLKQVEPKLAAEQKISVYQTASITRWAIIEGAAFLILFIKPELLIAGIVLLLYLLFLRPSENQMNKDFDNNTPI